MNIPLNNNPTTAKCKCGKLYNLYSGSLFCKKCKIRLPRDKHQIKIIKRK